MKVHSQQSINPMWGFLREEGRVSEIEGVHFAAGQKSIEKIHQNG